MSDLEQQVTIRGQAVSVLDALHRSLAHTSYHVGQIVYLAKEEAGAGWTSLSIPKGQSAAFNQNPTGQKPARARRAARSQVVATAACPRPNRSRAEGRRIVF